MEDDEKHAEKAAPDAHLQKLASIGNDGRRQEQRGGDTDETFAEGDVFEDGPIEKATEPLNKKKVEDTVRAEITRGGFANSIQ